MNTAIGIDGNGKPVKAINLKDEMRKRLDELSKARSDAWEAQQRLREAEYDAIQFAIDHRMYDALRLHAPTFRRIAENDT